MNKPRRPNRIRCNCCVRLMSYIPYGKNEAIRRRPPLAGVCLDCEPGLVRLVYPDATPYCKNRNCAPASAVDKLATLAQDQDQR